MKYLTLYRKDFKINPDDGTSFFEDILQELGVDKMVFPPGSIKWNKVEKIEFGVRSILNIFDENDNTVV